MFDLDNKNLKSIEIKQTKRLAFEMSLKKDALILKTVKFVLGENWERKEIVERGRIFCYPDKRGVFCFDDREMIVFYPVEIFYCGKELKTVMNYEELYLDKGKDAGK